MADEHGLGRLVVRANHVVLGIVERGESER